MDKGYDLKDVHDLAAEFGMTTRICARGDKAKTLRRHVGYRIRRGVGELSHS